MKTYVVEFFFLQSYRLQQCNFTKMTLRHLLLSWKTSEQVSLQFLNFEADKFQIRI